MKVRVRVRARPRVGEAFPRVVVDEMRARVRRLRHEGVVVREVSVRLRLGLVARRELVFLAVEDEGCAPSLVSFKGELVCEVVDHHVDEHVPARRNS